MAPRLTPVTIEKLKAKATRYETSDGGNGVFLITQPSGAKSFCLRFRVDGRPKKLTLGGWPTMSLKAARAAAAIALKQVEDGVDPTEVKKAGQVKQRQVEADTFQAIAESHIKREGKNVRSMPWRQKVLARLVYPVLGSRPISSIKRSEIVRLLDKIEDERGPAMANQTLMIIRTIMNWHAVRDDDFRSAIVRGMARDTNGARDRILTDDELRAVWLTAEKTPGPFPALIRFLLATGARRTEAAAMPRSEVVDGTWTLPPERSKSGAEVVRPLSDLALAVLSALPDLGPYYFTNTGRTPISGYSKAKRAFDTASGTSGWTLHDLRRSSRSLLSRAGVSVDHSERCLGHVIGGVRGVYDRHAFHDEMKIAYQRLSALIESIVHPPEGNVVPLRQA